MTNVYTGDGSVWFSPSTTHTGLQPIGTSARQHLVDTDDVEWVDTDTHVESILSGSLSNVLVCADTSGFEGFRRKLFVFVGD